MRQLLLLLLLAIFSSFCLFKDPTELWKEYHFPADKIGKGKTFVYSELGATSENTLTDVRLITESGKRFVLRSQHNSGSTFDSLKFDINYNLVEIYYSMPSDSGSLLVKGDIIEDKIIDNGTKLGKSVSKIVYAESEISITFNTQDEYLKDTVLTWQGQQMNCVVTRTQSTVNVLNKVNPLEKQDVEISNYSYYAKGIGVLRYISSNKEGSSTWQLVEIKDLNK